MNVDEQIKTAYSDMVESEEILLAKGFPKEHWAEIKAYIGFAILHTQLHVAKSMSDHSEDALKRLSEVAV